MSNIFQSKKLVKSMSQVPNLGRLLCRSKFESQHKNHEVKNCGKNCVSCPYLLQSSLYQFKRVNKTFLQKNSFNYESSNLCCHLPRMQRRIYRRKKLSIESANKYLQTTNVLQLAVEEHLRTCGDGKFHMFPFLKIIQEIKSLRKSYEDYFIDKFRPLLNKSQNLLKQQVLNMK